MKKLDLDDSTLASLRSKSESQDVQFAIIDSLAQARAALFMYLALSYAEKYEAEAVQKFARELLKVCELSLSKEAKAIYDKALLVTNKSPEPVEALALVFRTLRANDA